MVWLVAPSSVISVLDVATRYLEILLDVKNKQSRRFKSTCCFTGKVFLYPSSLWVTSVWLTCLEVFFPNPLGATAEKGFSMATMQ